MKRTVVSDVTDGYKWDLLLMSESTVLKSLKLPEFLPPRPLWGQKDIHWGIVCVCECERQQVCILMFLVNCTSDMHWTLNPKQSRSLAQDVHHLADYSGNSTDVCACVCVDVSVCVRVCNC